MKGLFSERLIIEFFNPTKSYLFWSFTAARATIFQKLGKLKRCNYLKLFLNLKSSLFIILDP